uniref:Uncharacterized protein n=1 Tax=Knipowitschia caucasica TaxID=637954 RepID=A0AAV2KKA6_KNICA
MLGTKVLSGLEPYTLIVAVVVLGLVVCVLLWGIWRSSQKREVKRCDHLSLSNQPDDGLTYTAGELLSSSGSTTARLRRDHDSYTKKSDVRSLRRCRMSGHSSDMTAARGAGARRWWRCGAERSRCEEVVEMWSREEQVRGGGGDVEQRGAGARR